MYDSMYPDIYLSFPSGTLRPGICIQYRDVFSAVSSFESDFHYSSVCSVDPFCEWKDFLCYCSRNPFSFATRRFAVRLFFPDVIPTEEIIYLFVACASVLSLCVSWIHAMTMRPSVRNIVSLRYAPCFLKQSAFTEEIRVSPLPLLIFRYRCSLILAAL